MLGYVMLLLMVPCTKLIGILAARTARRHQQFALQTALGAPRIRIATQIAAEGVSIGLAGGVVGVLIASPAAAILASVLPTDAMPAGPPVINGLVLAFCVAV